MYLKTETFFISTSFIIFSKKHIYKSFSYHFSVYHDFVRLVVFKLYGTDGRTDRQSEKCNAASYKEGHTTTQ